MRALERWLPRWLNLAPTDARPPAAVYMSGSGVAVAKGLYRDGRFHVELPADDAFDTALDLAALMRAVSG